jgi:Zn-dependent protease
LTGRETGLTVSEVIPRGLERQWLFGATAYFEPFASPAANLFVRNMLWVNIAWGIINLLPVYPLDGGRVAREVLTLRHPRRGIVWSYQLSAVVAGSMALYGLFAWHSLFTALMFGYLSYMSYQSLQAYQRNSW